LMERTDFESEIQLKKQGKEKKRIEISGREIDLIMNTANIVRSDFDGPKQEQ